MSRGSWPTAGPEQSPPDGKCSPNTGGNYNLSATAPPTPPSPKEDDTCRTKHRRLTALVVKTLSVVDPVVSVDHQTLSDSVSWLIRSAQQPDGSFKDESSVRPNKVMAAGTAAVDQSVYVTSFVLMALHRATSIKDPILQLRFHDDSMRSAANYISQHAPGVKSVYVRAVATYALTLHDPNSLAASELLDSLEKLARDKGNPAVLRYWEESSVKADWLKPDQSSALMVETTAYVLLTVLLKGRIPYANPILSWLTQDQHYGEGFYSIQDTVLTLEAVTEYSRVVLRAVLNQDINVRYGRKGPLGRVNLSQSRPVATPIQVMKDDVIKVSTGYGKGVSNVKLKTVYYETSPPAQNCNFDLTIEVAGPDSSVNAVLSAPHLVACAKYKPPPNEVFTESSLTVMKIQLPTGVEAFLEDLRQFRDIEDPNISHFELQGNTVIIQMDAVPSDVFLCVGFRIRTMFRVGGASQSLFSVYEPQDKGSQCTKQFTYQQQELQRLCVDEQCQCMTAACAAYRGNIDVALTAAKRTNETCRPQIKYAYKVTVKSSAAEGDFMTYTATVEEVLKNTDKEFEAVSSGTEVELVKKVTCSAVDLQNSKQYLVMGASGSEVTLSQGFKSVSSTSPLRGACVGAVCVRRGSGVLGVVVSAGGGGAGVSSSRRCELRRRFVRRSGGASAAPPPPPPPPVGPGRRRAVGAAPAESAAPAARRPPPAAPCACGAGGGGSAAPAMLRSPAGAGGAGEAGAGDAAAGDRRRHGGRGTAAPPAAPAACGPARRRGRRRTACAGAAGGRRRGCARRRRRGREAPAAPACGAGGDGGAGRRRRDRQGAAQSGDGGGAGRAPARRRRQPAFPFCSVVCFFSFCCSFWLFRFLVVSFVPSSPVVRRLHSPAGACRRRFGASASPAPCVWSARRRLRLARSRRSRRRPAAGGRSGAGAAGRRRDAEPAGRRLRGAAAQDPAATRRRRLRR
ncbi:complement C5-like [Cottoperca gobio]|uniref:Complement C5-like n=1 Tax=Cottoperca gobio TaxID=56716 RepID=A0A6J2PEG5_COTGO|nr:complement C5-like [Cottoperca gobio]